MKLAFEEALGATRGTAVHPERFPPLFEVTTDTRTMHRDDVYLALRGNRFDGHEFLPEAYERGARAAIVEHVPPGCGDLPCIIVADTKDAYMVLAGAARTHLTGRVIALSGSTGKTTTKTFLEQMLRAEFGEQVAATPANENNEIGVSKLLLSVNPDAAVVIVEMGARHHHDLAPLTDIAQPDIAILTNVGEAHLEIMGTRQKLAETKWEIFSRGAQAVLNWDDAASRERWPSLSAEPYWFTGAESHELKNEPRNLTALTRTVLTILSNGRRQEMPVDVRVPGAHNLSNVAAAVAGATALGMPWHRIAHLLPALQLPPGRYERIATAGGANIIYDAYNASLSGMIATLDAFAREPGRRIAVLSSMAELGPEAPHMHAVVGAHLRGAGIAAVLVGGEFSEALARGAREAGFPSESIIPFASNTQAVRWLRANTGAGDAVLVKGSRIYKLEEIVQALVVDA